MSPDSRMQLEQRVKTLEYEMKILKNEVQRTLLDIQEQVLIHYYPALRGEDSMPPESTQRTFADIQAKKRSMDGTSSGNPGQTVILGPGQNAQRNGQSGLMKLSEWVSDSVKKLGKERTTKLVEVYAKHGFIVPDSKDILLRFVALGEENGHAEHMSINEITASLVQLNDLLEMQADTEQSIALIKEAGLG